MSKQKDMKEQAAGSVSSKKSGGGGMFVTLILVIIALVPAGYFYVQYKDAQKQLSDQTSAATQSEIQKLVEEVGKLIELPDENPTVATVSDTEKLKEQVFFANAETGDKVLIFTEAKKAILYRPSTNKVVEVGPVTIKPQEGANTNASSNTNSTTNINSK